MKTWIENKRYDNVTNEISGEVDLEKTEKRKILEHGKSRNLLSQFLNNTFDSKSEINFNLIQEAIVVAFDLQKLDKNLENKNRNYNLEPYQKEYVQSFLIFIFQLLSKDLETSKLQIKNNSLEAKNLKSTKIIQIPANAIPAGYRLFHNENGHFMDEDIWSKIFQSLLSYGANK